MIAEIILNSAGHLASFKRIQQSKTVGSKNFNLVQVKNLSSYSQYFESYIKNMLIEL